MSVLAWGQRFFKTTRGRIVHLLRRANRTVDDLARDLALTDNAVRVHLATLERDGMVRPAGVRRDGSVGKPATVYEITPEAEPALSAAYAPVLRAVVASLAHRLSSRELAGLMRDVGRRLAADHATATGTLRARANVGSALLNDLGGLTTVAEERGSYVIRGSGCPLSVTVAEHPEVCVVVQTLLSDVTGASVRTHCEHGERPQCRFELAGAGSARH